MKPENFRKEFLDYINCDDPVDVEDAAAQIYEILSRLQPEDSLLALFVSTCHYALKKDRDGKRDADATIGEIIEVLPPWLRYTRREFSAPAD